ncbi:MAG: hypothetical protein U0354_09610 [Candidatus Sericytochromatia bacterium]
MFISNNDQVKNIVSSKPKNETKVEKKEEVKKTQEINIPTEKVKISETKKGKEIPSIPVINFSEENSIKSKVSISKSIVDQAVELDFDDKAGLIKKSVDFSKSLDGMDNSELLEVADYIRHLLQETLGTDDILGAFQSTVFDKMKENMNSTPLFIKPMPFEYKFIQ